MTQRTPEVLEALRLPELCREICRYAGLPLPTLPGAEGRFVVRCGVEPPDFFAMLLEEALVEDEAEVVVQAGPLDLSHLGPCHIAVRPGFDTSCPAAEDLLGAAATAGPKLFFAIERYDDSGRLLGITWAAVPEREPAPESPFRAAVLREDAPAGPDHERQNHRAS
jgi:hypothetical protein